MTDPRELPSVMDEARLFSEDEFEKALLLVTTPEEARKFAHDAVHWNKTQLPGVHWQLLDVLDLLSLVSEDCAQRVANLLKLSPEAAKERRELIAQELGRPR